MRVALVVQKLAGLRGGAERVVIDLGVAMASRGHDVTIVSYEPATGAPAYDISSLRHVNVFPRAMGAALRRRAASGGLDGLEHSISVSANSALLNRAKWAVTHGLFSTRLAAWLRSHPHDVVVGFLPPAISAVAQAADRLGARAPRTIASTHSRPDEDFGDSLRWDQNPVARRRNLEALEVVDAVTVLQPEFVAQLPPPAQQRAVVIGNSVVPLATPVDRTRLPRIIGVGRLASVKRYDLLIRAFAALSDEFPDTDLVIYGEGPERPHLERLVVELGVEARVELPGVVEGLADVYDTAAVLAHPAEFEGFGLAVAEALLHSLPVVAWKDCTGVNALVEANVSGLLIERSGDDVADFSAGLTTILRHPLAVAGRIEAAQRLGLRLAPTGVYDRWEQLLQGNLS